MKIAFMGIRGIPASYSGFETFVEQTARRLVRRGHEVTVYNRSSFVPYRGKEYLGVRLVHLPTLATKHLDSIVHTFLCCIHAMFQKYNVVYICGVGNAPLAFILRIRKTKVIVNVDGADWKRDKWSRFARTYLRLCEPIATKSAHAVIADSKVIKKRYLDLFGINTLYIPYGANIRRYEGSDLLERFGLESRRYVLFVGRLVPENCAHTLIRAFKRVETDLKLVIVGDAPYSSGYKQSLIDSGGKNTVYTGYLFGEEYQEISSNAYLYVMASGVDGTRPVLLDQMAFGNAILTRNTPANMEVVGDSAMNFADINDEEDLAIKLQYLSDHAEEVIALRAAAEDRVKEKYSWERVTDKYELLYTDLQAGYPVNEIVRNLEEKIPSEPVRKTAAPVEITHSVEEALDHE
ncbi:glycosyl transferase family 1 [candidate division LCP-89 bacterium B3_LCP]|uniref:Glycosyl transferase family 1 n=1 Tax=candidate division LCP-89 bacterium B3_LCP TaxID=2012998 RepID=A0A532V5S0_UNCL8|nr:MAG: glycosyl transferase family 1 [candidate division LCP-89 bacterium B3_LCP]